MLAPILTAMQAQASHRGDIGTMALLQAKGARIDCDGYTPLMAASEFGELQAVKWLADRGVNVAAAALL